MTVLLLRAMRSTDDATVCSQEDSASIAAVCSQSTCDAGDGAAGVRGLPRLCQRMTVHGASVTLAQAAACTVAAALRYVVLGTPASKFSSCKAVHGARLRRRSLPPRSHPRCLAVLQG